MAVARNSSGPLVHSKLIQFREVVWWDQTRPPFPIEERPDDAEYLVKEPDRLDLIAYNELGDEQLGWVILERNNLRLVPNDLVPGRTLYIPSIDGLKERGILP
jgi:hypothetical protein|tara:strand:+ start:21 stop:329 length:309 start_codon:yes stop_codon:yes gene_type:complete